MARRSTVSVYSVHANGSTGALVGAGMLVDPLLVLAAPPLDARLAGGEALRLRLGIAATGTGAVEVLDVAHVKVSKGAGEVLVGLELAAPAESPPDVVDGLQDAQDDADLLRAAGVAALAGLADPAAPGSTAGGAVRRPPGVTHSTGMHITRRSPFCAIFGWGCPKKK